MGRCFRRCPLSILPRVRWADGGIQLIESSLSLKTNHRQNTQELTGIPVTSIYGCKEYRYCERKDLLAATSQRGLQHVGHRRCANHQVGKPGILPVVHQGRAVEPVRDASRRPCYSDGRC